MWWPPCAPFVLIILLGVFCQKKCQPARTRRSFINRKQARNLPPQMHTDAHRCTRMGRSQAGSSTAETLQIDLEQPRQCDAHCPIDVHRCASVVPHFLPTVTRAAHRRLQAGRPATLPWCGEPYAAWRAAAPSLPARRSTSPADLGKGLRGCRPRPRARSRPPGPGWHVARDPASPAGVPSHQRLTLCWTRLRVATRDRELVHEVLAPPAPLLTCCGRAARPGRSGAWSLIRARRRVAAPAMPDRPGAGSCVSRPDIGSPDSPRSRLSGAWAFARARVRDPSATTGAANAASHFGPGRRACFDVHPHQFQMGNCQPQNARHTMPPGRARQGRRRGGLPEANRVLELCQVG